MEKHNNPTDKLTDKAFSRFALTSLLGILVCIVCLCSTTYAWFVDSAPSKDNEIKVADKCLLSVTVTNEGTPLDNIENGVELEAGKTYTVTLSLPSSSSSGYCLISAGGVDYYSDYILRHEEATPKTLSFTLTVATTQEVTFTPRWGIHAKDSSAPSGTLSLP